MCDFKLFSIRQLPPQELHQLGLVDIVLQGHRWLSRDLVLGKLSPSRDREVLLDIEEHLHLAMLLVPRPLREACLAGGTYHLSWRCLTT